MKMVGPLARTRATHPDQLPFDWSVPKPATLPAALAGVDARTARAVSEILKHDVRDRVVIAAEMSVLLDYDVSKAMLDAYASPARDEHNISFGRMKALIAVSNRVDIFDREVRDIGLSVLDGDDIYAAQASHIRSEIAELTQQLKIIERLNPSITRNRRK